ncbi:hypothetical protein BJX63DRAFT_428792 [Aspergillus granulosus]|uniref:Uncharacterized protein n=1 Tax=Aspergillus granulosus TaxID=176169 RepID=A0ABR4HUI3_9EURO
MSERRDNIPPYVDPSTVPLGRELGILFGFLLASLVIMAVYTVIWRCGGAAIERREEARDRLRKERLVAQGVHHGRGGLHEKMLDQEVLRPRAELPGHSTLGIREIGERSRSPSRVRERERSIPRRGREEEEVVRSRRGSRMREAL